MLCPRGWVFLRYGIYLALARSLAEGNGDRTALSAGRAAGITIRSATRSSSRRSGSWDPRPGQRGPDARRQRRAHGCGGGPHHRAPRSPAEALAWLTARCSRSRPPRCHGRGGERGVRGAAVPGPGRGRRSGGDTGRRADGAGGRRARWRGVAHPLHRHRPGRVGSSSRTCEARRREACWPADGWCCDALVLWSRAHRGGIDPLIASNYGTYGDFLDRPARGSRRSRC